MSFAVPSIVSGGRPSSDEMRAPIRSSGTMIRRIGRRRRGVISGDGRREWLGGEDSRQHPDRAAGIAGVQKTGGRLQPTQAASLDLDVETVARILPDLPYRNTEPAEAAEASTGSRRRWSSRECVRRHRRSRRAARTDVRSICRRADGRGRARSRRGGP